MPDTCTISLPNAEFTHSAGLSLRSSLYTQPCTITLSGELGAGKTTFLQGFLQGLGVTDHITSPTYALEQRYETTLGTVSHIDLYRLDNDSAKQFLRELDDDCAIRCIEWPERSNTSGDIAIHLAEDEAAAGRNLTVSFTDIPLPDPKTIALWRDEASLPDAVKRHCDAVADFALVLAEDLTKRGVILRPQALYTAAQLHDLLRFVDFTPGAAHEELPSEPDAWEEWRQQYQGLGHEAACAKFLRKRGFEALADIIEVHGLQLPSPKRSTIEQQLLFYADKRVMQDTVVSLEERFDDFRNRYANGKKTEEGQTWLKEAMHVEQALFPTGPITV